MIAALYVMADGIYSGRPDVDCWDEARDARNYAGPWPVVTHPPCSRWGRYANGGPGARVRRIVGDDEGCFLSALVAVRAFGGVLEHPAGSLAFTHFGLERPPHGGGWKMVRSHEWVCEVAQGNYGHRANKSTWLYVVGPKPPELIWGKAPLSDARKAELASSPDRKRAIKTGICQRMSRKQRQATPPEFAELLLSIARTAIKEKP